MQSNSRIKNPFQQTQSPFTSHRSIASPLHQHRTSHNQNKQEDYFTRNNDTNKNNVLHTSRQTSNNVNPFQYFQLHGRYDKCAYKSENKQHFKNVYTHQNSVFPMSKYETRLKLQSLDTDYWKKQAQQKQRYKLEQFGAEALRYSNYSTATPSMQMNSNTQSRKNIYNTYSSPQKLGNLPKVSRADSHSNQIQHSVPRRQNNETNYFESAEHNRQSKQKSRKFIKNDSFHEHTLTDSQQLPKFSQNLHGHRDNPRMRKNSHSKQKLNGIKQSFGQIKTSQNYVNNRQSGRRLEDNDSDPTNQHHLTERQSRYLNQYDSKQLKNFYDASGNESDPQPHNYLHNTHNQYNSGYHNHNQQNHGSHNHSPNKFSSSRAHKKNPYDSYISESAPQQKPRGPLHLSLESSDQQKSKKYLEHDSIREINRSGANFMGSGFSHRNHKYSSINEKYQNQLHYRSRGSYSHPQTLTYCGRDYHRIQFI